MIEKVFYIAEDGTKFEDRCECEKYEKLRKGKKEVLHHLQGLEDYCQSINQCKDCIISNLCNRIVDSIHIYGTWSEFTDLINKE